MTQVEHYAEQMLQVLLFLKRPEGHSMRHKLGEWKIYPERQVRQLVAVLVQVRQGCKQARQTFPET